MIFYSTDQNSELHGELCCMFEGWIGLLSYDQLLYHWNQFLYSYAPPNNCMFQCLKRFILHLVYQKHEANKACVVFVLLFFLKRNSLLFTNIIFHLKSVTVESLMNVAVGTSYFIVHTLLFYNRWSDQFMRNILWFATSGNSSTLCYLRQKRWTNEINATSVVT